MVLVKKMAYFSYSMLFFANVIPLVAQPSDPFYYESERPDARPIQNRTANDPHLHNYNRPMKPQSESFTPASELDSHFTDWSNNHTTNPIDTSMEKIDSILIFWFGYLESPVSFPVQKIPLWEGNPQVNQELLNRFAQDYQNAANGHYSAWRQTAKGRLALIILLDLLPRHMYVNQARMFATDAMALGLAQEGIREGDDLKLFPIERVFFYMPFQHSENREIQELSVKLYKKLVQQSPDQIKPIMQEFLRLAVKHKETIDRFGRFPHRNKILDRTSTEKELEYLSQELSLRY